MLRKSIIKNPSWLESKVIPGTKLAGKLGFPTLNLDSPGLFRGQKKGVYAADIKISGKLYIGALYYGPRFIQGETENILEIHVFCFDNDIYGQTVYFRPRQFIRPPAKFKKTADYILKLKDDIRRITKIFSSSSK